MNRPQEPAAMPADGAVESAPKRFTLVFDWGDTLMKVFPQYEGPMAAWPEVAEVDGIVEALESLLGRHSMAVATNAADSGAELVWKALRRVGLGEYFKAVFTARELGGARKPETAFFRQLESVLDRPTHELVMVGDDYRADILGAKAAGWHAIWYNPRRQAAPALLPQQDAEVHDLRDLPQALHRLSLPDYPTCLSWLLERGIPYNILAHIQLVASSAYQLAVWLAEKGQPVDALLAHRGALLHDLAKIDSIRQARERGPHGDHAAMARDLLLQRGQPALAEIANRHMPFSDPQDPRRPLTWEQKIVHYADKLSEGSRLVPIEERLQALQLRYPNEAGALQESWPRLEEIQAEICAILETTPHAMYDRLRLSLGYR